MSRKVKCRHCNIADTSKDEMEFEMTTGKKPVKKYYHKNCYEEYLKEKEFKEKEAEELDSLKTTIEKIFGVKQLPNQAYPFLQKLRNGEQVFGKQAIGKRYKQGYAYSLIEETFDHCEDTIHYWLGAKDFDSFMGAFKYSLSIVIDKIYFVEQRVKEQEQKRLLLNKQTEKYNEVEEIYETSYKKPSKSKNDISDFLDD